MPTTLKRAAISPRQPKRSMAPSKVDPANARPFTLDQELEPFGAWVGEPIWVPPKDSSRAMAETMYNRSSILGSRDKRWSSVVAAHRTQFTHVREIELHRASIRLPKGRCFVSALDQQHFDRITDPIPRCVQTRLDEFLAGPGKKHGVRVYYLKPLCVEVGDDLVFTTQEDLLAAIDQIKQEVFAEYRKLYLRRVPGRAARGALNLALAIPRGTVNYFIRRRQRAIEAYHAQLEFERRKTALRAARVHRKFRTDGCSYDEMLALTNPLQQADVIEQYGVEHELSRANRDFLIRMAAGSVPWFVTLSLAASYLSSLSLALAPPVMVCDPAFVAEMPGSRGLLLKIGHFDEIAGITHVEI